MTNYKRAVRRTSAGMLALALLLRVVIATGLDRRTGQAVAALLRRPETASFLFYLELGQAAAWQPEAPSPAAPADKPEEEAPAPETAPPAPEKKSAAEAPPDPPPAEEADVPAEPPAEPGLTFTQADADGIAIGGKCTYAADKLALLQQPSALDFQQAGPTVLIVHTHTSEAYAQEAGWEYDENDTARTQDPEFSVVRVGDALAEVLESHGIAVLHDRTLNDYPSYSGAYDRTLGKIQAHLAQHPSIQMVIDLHRDAAADADGNPVHHTADIGGEATARLMLVVGTDEGGLAHPGWRDNLSWALKLQAVLNRMYPGLCRDLDLRTERFNQHATPGSLLVEVGASGNTLREALAAARDLGEGLAALIEGS